MRHIGKTDDHKQIALHYRNKTIQSKSNIVQNFELKAPYKGFRQDGSHIKKSFGNSCVIQAKFLFPLNETS